jgi:hypothetical protein
MDPRCIGLWVVLLSGSTLFIDLFLLLRPRAACFADGAETEVDDGPEKDRAFLASRKSVSGNAIFKISKKRSCTFLASVLTYMM